MVRCSNDLRGEVVLGGVGDAGGDEVDPVIEVDDAAFEETVAGLEEEHGRPPREGAVRFPGGKVKTVKARSGLGLDREATLEALRAAYVAGEPATLPLTDTQPEISDDDVAEAVDSFAEPAVSGPVTLVFEGARVKLTPAEFAEFKRVGLEMGFRYVESGPLVRSSYHAHEHKPENA